MTSAQSIVGELLKLDPSLQPHRAALESAVHDILAAKPDTQFTPEFRKRLLSDLRSRLAAQEPSSGSFSLSLMLQRFLFAGGGAVVGALLVFVTLSKPSLFSTTGRPDPTSIAPQQTVRNVGPAAFGELSMAANTRPQSGGGGGDPSIDAKMSSSMIVAPDMTVIEYTYDGDIALPEGDVDVFRRSPRPADTSVDQLIGDSFAARLFDIGRFRGLKAQNISMTSGEYSLSVDFMDGSVWINRNYTSGDRPESQCRDQACFERYRLKESDMLPDDRVISIARGFLDSYGIDLSNYGQPEVMNDWRVWLAATSNPRDFYFPEQMTVTFPMLINGTPVYEEYGNAYGLQVTVDIRMKEVSSVANLRLYDMERSAYAAAADEAAVREALKKGGTMLWMPEDAKKATATLQEPSAAYVHIYQWDEKTMQSSELFVPGLAFPIEAMPSDTDQSRTRVVLPLAEEMIQRINDQSDIGRPIPLDLVR